MATYLGLDIVTVATINLILQTATYILLWIGFTFARKGNYRRHGKFQMTAILLILISLAIVMLPSLYSIVSGISPGSLEPSQIFTVLHHTLGAITLAMAGIAVAVLRPCGSIRGKQKLGNVRFFMIALFVLWTIVYLMGIYAYSLLYLSY